MSAPPAEPPPEAEPQPDGSRLLWLSEHKSVRYTARTDGSWRRPEPVQAVGRGAARQLIQNQRERCGRCRSNHACHSRLHRTFDAAAAAEPRV